MKYCPDKPDIYATILKYFPEVDWDRGVAICYGDTIYSKNQLSPDVASHEEIHMYQQKDIGPERWWKEYLTNKQFRLTMEKEAYFFQVKFLRHAIKDRNKLARVIHRLAVDMSSTMYGNMCSYSEALKFLRAK